jgi:hypothetical protein
VADNDDVDMNLLFTVYCQPLLFQGDEVCVSTYPMLTVLLCCVKVGLEVVGSTERLTCCSSGQRG